MEQPDLRGSERQTWTGQDRDERYKETCLWTVWREKEEITSEKRKFYTKKEEI